MTDDDDRTADANPTEIRPMITPRTQRALETLDGLALGEMRALREETERFMQRYKFGIDEVVTKLSILREEFSQAHDYNPIEHISSRLKSIDSVIEKMERKGVEPSFEAIESTITDIAGVRVTCSFVSDAYRIFELLTAQSDVRVLQVKDYIADPKPNGYQSLHAIVEVPVFLSTGEHPVAVEVQFRTIAMDFWASLEHKIYYKFDRQVPAELLDELTSAAHTAAELDTRMERLHRQVHGLPAAAREASASTPARPPAAHPDDSFRGPVAV